MISPTTIGSAESVSDPSLAGTITLLDGIASGEEVGIPVVYDISHPAALFVGGRPSKFWESTFKIRRVLNGRDTASYSKFFLLGQTYPARDAEVILLWKGVRRFGGLITNYEEESIDGSDTSSKLTVNMTGYDGLFDRIVVHKLYIPSVGGTPGQILYDIWYRQLREFGVTKVGDFGPAILLGPVLFHYVTGSEAVRMLLAMEAGWNIWIDENKELHYERLGTAAPNAPFNIRDNQDNYSKISIKKDTNAKRNREYVLPSKDLEGIFTEVYTGDGVNFVFITLYEQVQKPKVTLNGVEIIVTLGGDWVAGWEAYYTDHGTAIFFRVTPALADAIVVQYPCPFPVAAVAEDTADIEANGLWEGVYHAKNCTDLATAGSIGQGLLDNNIDEAEEIKLAFNSEKNLEWLAPGHVVSIIKTIPAISGDYVVESVDSNDQEALVWRHNATLRAKAGLIGADVLESILASTRVAQVMHPLRLKVDLGKDNPPTTNPGITLTGLINEYSVMPYILGGCALKDWDISAAITAVTGSPFIIDVEIDGVSIYDAAFRPTIPLLDNSIIRGYRFADPDRRFTGGEIVRINVIQVGVAKRIVYHLNLRA